MEQKNGFCFHFEQDRQPKPLTDTTRLILYRVARELLLNIVKHAQAHNVWMELNWNEDDVKLVLKDDGVGFNPTGFGEGFSQTGGFGLFQIRQQLHHIGGHFEIETVPGSGTRVVVVAPLA